MDAVIFWNYVQKAGQQSKGESVKGVNIFCISCVHILYSRAGHSESKQLINSTPSQGGGDFHPTTVLTPSFNANSQSINNGNNT